MPRILTVEDDTDLLFIYELTFSRQGYEVVSVDDMSKAIVYLTQDDFDLIILDINMPDMPGTKLIEFIQGDARLQHIPIIVVSAGERWKNEVYSLGVEHFMVKPVKLRELTALIARLLSE